MFWKKTPTSTADGVFGLVGVFGVLGVFGVFGLGKKNYAAELFQNFTQKTKVMTTWHREEGPEGPQKMHCDH